MSFRSFPAAVAISMVFAAATPAAAQQRSASYRFLDAVRQSKGNEVQSMLNEPGSSVINTRDISSGEGALHIVVKRGDNTYLRFLLAKGADPNLRDGKGNTPLLVAANLAQPLLVESLIAGKADVNLANESGETPLILAVQRRDLGMARLLLAAGADPDRGDVIAGMSARDYARQDTRSPALAKLLAEAPRKARRAVSGPSF